MTICDVQCYKITSLLMYDSAGIMLGMGSTNERGLYYVTPSLIGWTHTQIDPGNDKQIGITSIH